MALRLIQIKLPDSDYDSIFEIIADQKFVTTWLDHRASGQLILQLMAPAEACEAIMDKFDQRFKDTEGFHILLLAVEAALPRLEEEVETEKSPPTDGADDASEKKHRISREELYAEINQVTSYEDNWLESEVLRVGKRKGKGTAAEIARDIRNVSSNQVTKILDDLLVVGKVRDRGKTQRGTLIYGFYSHPQS